MMSTINVGIWVPSPKGYPARWVDQWVFDHKNFNLIIYRTLPDLATTAHQLHIFLLTDMKLWPKVYKYYDLRNITVDMTKICDAEELEDILEERFPEYFDDLHPIKSPSSSYDLRSRSTVPIEPTPTRIPQIINLMWISDDGRPPPQKYLANIQAWTAAGYKIKLWDNEMVDSLIRTHLPEYFYFYKSLKWIMSKCQFARFAVVYVEGGFYFDLDFHVHTNLFQQISTEDEIMIAMEPPELGENLSVKCFGATKGHPFIGGWLDQMEVNVDKVRKLRRDQIEITTGGPAFYRYYKDYACYQIPPPLFDTCSLMPYNKRHALSKVCLSAEPDIATYNLWKEGTGWEEWPIGYFELTIISAIFLVMAIIIIVALLFYGKLPRIRGGDFSFSEAILDEGDNGDNIIKSNK